VTAGVEIALPRAVVGQADRDVDGDDGSVEGVRQVGEREEDVGGDVVGFGLFDDGDPSGWATIHSCDFGHEGMICG
jgi:hypothetical protein